MKYSILIFILACFQACTQPEVKNTKAGNPTPQYQTYSIEKGGLATSIKLPAQLTAYQEVSIFPKVNGFVQAVWVDIGSKVQKGSRLLQLEAPELEQAVLQAREKYIRSKSELAIDTEHYLRLLQASQTAGAVSPFDLSSLRSKVISDSALCNAEKANWDMQHTMMNYLQVTAPFEGVITERNIHPGALVSAAVKDRPMIQLKQINQLRLQIDVPEYLSSQLKEKDTVYFLTSVSPGKKNTGLISRKSNNINTQFRSEKIEIDVLNPGNSLSPGMYADVIIEANGSPDAFTVPKSAIVNATEGKYLIVLQNGKTRRVSIRTRNETAGKTEVFGLLQSGDMIILNANDEIK